jgi:hypothetical protein
MIKMMTDGEKILQQEETAVWGQKLQIKLVEKENKNLGKKGMYTYIGVCCFLWSGI